MPNLLIVRNSYPDLESVQRLLNYVLRTSFYGGYAIDPEYAFDQMRLVKEAYHKTEGVQLKHFLLTFSHEEMMHLDFKDLLELGFQVGKVLERYQIVYCIHLDSDYIHMHFVMNTVSFEDGKKYSDGLVGFQRVKDFLEKRFPKWNTQLIFREVYAAHHYKKT